jgi:lauroyl/myristoyl acyltransferase
MDVQGLFSGEFGVRAAELLGRVLPPRLGYSLADFLAERIASRRKSRIVRAVRANQWVAHGEKPAAAELDRIVRDALHHSARSVFELYHGLQHTSAAQERLVFDSSAELLLRRPEFADRGLVVASIHLGNFDLVLHLASLRGIKPLILTISDPRGGRRMELESRKRAGAVLLPASIPAFRKAIRHLERGGMVATGIDRPIADPRIRPMFFGRPASLPLHHVFLASRARVPVLLLATVRRPNGTHLVFASQPMEMQSDPDRETEARRNAETVLQAAEKFIGGAPAQWTVSLPVWPEILESVP